MMRKVNIISSLIAMAIAIFFYYNTLDFPSIKSTETGADFMPKIFSGGLMILGIILFVQSFFTKEKSPEEKMNMIALTAGILLIYLFFIQLLGFYSSTILFMIALLLITKVRKMTILIFVPVGISFFIFIFFEKMLKVPIPSGFLF